MGTAAAVHAVCMGWGAVQDSESSVAVGCHPGQRAFEGGAARRRCIVCPAKRVCAPLQLGLGRSVKEIAAIEAWLAGLVVNMSQELRKARDRLRQVRCPAAPLASRRAACLRSGSAAHRTCCQPGKGRSPAAAGPVPLPGSEHLGCACRSISLGWKSHRGPCWPWIPPTRRRTGAWLPCSAAMCATTALGQPLPASSGCAVHPLQRSLLANQRTMQLPGFSSMQEASQPHTPCWPHTTGPGSSLCCATQARACCSRHMYACPALWLR